MLKIKTVDGCVATWSIGDEQWKCSDEWTRSVLQNYYESDIQRKISSKDIYLEDGVSGFVWKLLKEFFGGFVELVDLLPERSDDEIEEEMEKTGIDY